MEKRFDYELEKAMDEAIMVLSRAFSESGHNEKPVILHSIRVGMTLFDLGYPKHIVLAGLLHDILEDTDFSAEDLRRRFGADVASIVSAVTFDPTISSKREQTEELFLRCRHQGFEALVVKCADILDNIDYFIPTPGYEDLASILLDKYLLFLNVGATTLAREPVYAMLTDKVRHAESLMTPVALDLTRRTT